MQFAVPSDDRDAQASQERFSQSEADGNRVFNRETTEGVLCLQAIVVRGICNLESYL